jgi:hypothetical protein
MWPPLPDLGSRRARRCLGRAGAAALALGIALLAGQVASAASPTPPPAASELRDLGAWRGVICTSPSCRPPSRWDAAAFAFVVVTVGWLARRRTKANS